MFVKNELVNVSSQGERHSGSSRFPVFFQSLSKTYTTLRRVRVVRLLTTRLDLLSNYRENQINQIANLVRVLWLEGLSSSKPMHLCAEK